MSSRLKKLEASFELTMAARDELLNECPDVAANLPPRPHGVLGVIRLDYDGRLSTLLQRSRMSDRWLARRDS